MVSKAQVGIGTNLPDNSAQLDVVSADKGVLITRVALTSSTDITTITNGNVESLLVYNTATIADITPRYYYWDGANWVRILSGAFAGDTNTTNVSLTEDGTNLILTDSDGNTVQVALADIQGTDTNTTNVNPSY